MMSLYTLLEVTHWHWLIFASLLLLIELFMAGGFFFCLSIAALMIFLIILIIPVHFINQLILFSCFAVCAIFLGRKYFKASFKRSPEKEVNLGSKRLIGQKVIVTEAIGAGKGRVRVGDSEWLATGPDAPVGSLVCIIAADGALLTVAND